MYALAELCLRKCNYASYAHSPSSIFRSLWLGADSCYTSNIFREVLGLSSCPDDLMQPIPLDHNLMLPCEDDVVQISERIYELMLPCFLGAMQM